MEGVIEREADTLALLAGLQVAEKHEGPND